jgi:outer membrane lipoprotein-sorting protein
MKTSTALALTISGLLAASSTTATAGGDKQNQGATGNDKRGLEIATQADRANSGFVGESSTMEMTIVNAHGDSTRRKMHSIVKEIKGDGDKSRIEFVWPADVKGTRMLTWSHKKGSDDQWLYLPAANRIKRISSRNRSGSFMGSEFSYEDLGSQEIEKFSHTFLADEVISGRKVWKNMRRPTEKKSGYSKQIVWLDKEYQNPLKIQYFDRKGDLLKTATFSGFAKHGKFWRPNKIEMINHQTRKRSTLLWKNRKLNVKHDDDEFDKDELAD